MEKQTVYIPVSKVTDFIISVNGIQDYYAEKKENVYVFTPQEFEKLIGDAFDAGKDWIEFHLAQGFLGLKNPNPDKTEYLNNLK